MKLSAYSCHWYPANGKWFDQHYARDYVAKWQTTVVEEVVPSATLLAIASKVA